MRKNKLFLGVIALCFSLAACSGSPEGGFPPGFPGGNGGGFTPSTASVSAANTYSVVITQSGNGTVAPSARSAKVGDIVSFTIMPSYGYRFEYLTVNDSNFITSLVNNTYKTPMVEGGLRIFVYFSSSTSPTSSYDNSQYPSSNPYWYSASNEGSRPSKHVHTAADDAPWQSNENRHWKDCKDNDGGKINNSAHTFEEIDARDPTCVDYGYVVERCTVCDYYRQRTLSPTDHEFGDFEVLYLPTCLEDGLERGYCRYCGVQIDIAIPATGHMWGDWEILLSPTCTEEGSHKHICTVCLEEETEVIRALGHDFHIVDSDTQPEAGKAKVRVYTCARCETSYLGFKATEVSESSKEHLVFETNSSGEVGARFWGRPIGNAMELSDDGSADGPGYGVYDRTVQGDFFEYVFDLTANQVASAGLDDCLLYCDAQPAQYLAGHDFWACESGDEEWTQGYYIDDGHPDGTPITDYRYLLYVDDEPVSFDPDMETPVVGNPGRESRDEFIMPYRFHLHAGTNKISLRMAGGFRSFFYNFTFRPVNTHPHQWTFDYEYQPSSGENDAIVQRYRCGCGEVKYTIDVADANMQLAPESAYKNDPITGEFKLKYNGDSASFTFNARPFNGKMYQRGYMDSYSLNLSTKAFYPNGSVNIDVEINGTHIDFSKYSSTTFEELFGQNYDGSNYSDIADVELGDVSLGWRNTITYKRLSSYNQTITQFIFIGRE